MMLDPWRTLAHDGARRQEVRSICTGWVIDYRYASWGEWLTLAAVVEAINDWATNRVLSSSLPQGASGPGGDRPTPTGQVTPNHNGDAA